MAENAELLLKVGLDLQYFRRELKRIGSELAGEPINITLKFERTMLAGQFRILDRYIRNKKFRVEIQTNLDSEIDKAEKLARLLSQMPPASSGRAGRMGPRTAGATARIQELQKLTRVLVREGGFDAAALRRVAQAAIDEGIGGIDLTAPANKLRQQLRVGFTLAADDANKGLINALLDSTTEVGRAAAKMGNTILDTLRTVLDTHSPSDKTFAIGKDTGKGLTNGTVSSVDDGATRIKQALNRLVGLFESAGRAAGMAFGRSFQEGRQAALKPGIQGALLGGAGGAATGATVGGIKALGAGVAGGLGKMGAMGAWGIAREMGRLGIGDTAGLTGFAQDVSLQVFESALHTGGEALLIGAAGVGGVAALAGFAKGSLKSLTRQALEGTLDATKSLIASGVASVSSGDLKRLVVREIVSARLAIAGIATKQLPAQVSAAAISGARDVPLLQGARDVPLLPSVTQTSSRRMARENALNLYLRDLTPHDLRFLNLQFRTAGETVKTKVSEVGEQLSKISDAAQAIARDLRTMGDNARLTGRAFAVQGEKRLYPQNYGMKIASFVGQLEKLNPTLRKLSVEEGAQLLAGIEGLNKALPPALNTFVDVAGVHKTLDQTLAGYDAAARRAQRATNDYADRIRRRAGLLGGAATGQRLLTGGVDPQPFGLLPSVSQSTARRESVASGLQAIFEAGGPRFPEGPSGKLALTAEALRERIDAILAEYFKVAEVTVKEIFDFDTKDLKKALRAFSFLPQALRDAQLRTIPGMPAVRGLLPSTATQSGRPAAGVGRMPSPYAMGGAGGGLESRAEMFARREREARIRSALRGMDVMGGGAGRTPSPYSYTYRPTSSAIVPYAPAGALVPGGGGPGGGGGGRPPGGGGNFRGIGGPGGSMGGFLSKLNLPGSGAIRELGQEFAFATKQVLLFGQAYKLLAFIQAFPGQVGQAVSQLQSFRNTLAAISPTAQEAAASNDLILSLVDKYNVPLQSARDGFTKLYASMQPAGFSGDQIRELFTGVSKAAATFGMSSDKIDRVNYAFAQMASKGQVMSEELKGQLGDVLPGAMAIFAQAAGFKGPEAISKFSAALEDGRYKGTAMMELLNNVSIVLNQKFSKGAEGAAKTFQGAINNMQTAMKGLYESFEPIAVAFLNGVVTPVMDGVKTITDGLNAFLSGTQAQTAGGFAFAQQLEALRPTFQGIAQNVQQLVPVIQQFGSILGSVAKIFLQIIGNPIVGYLAKLYAIFLPLNIALNVMRGLWISNAAQLLIFNARLVTGTSTLSAFRGMMAATGATAQTTSAAIRGAGLTLRAFFASTGIGLVLVGISLLIEKFISMNQRLDETRAKALGAAQAIRAMSATEARQAAFEAARDVKALQQLSQQRSVGGAIGQRYLITDKAQQAALQRAGISTQTVYNKQQGYGLAQGVRPEQLAGAIQARQGIMREAEYRQRQLKFEEQQATKPLTFAEIQAGGGDSGAARARGGADKAANDAKRLAEEIARQAQSASDALFAEQQRFTVLQATSPVAKAIAEYTTQEAIIRRQTIQDLEVAKSQEEKINIVKKSALQSRANALELEQKMVDASKEALKPIEDMIKEQKEQLRLEEETKRLVGEGMTPERAKQVAEVRRLVRAQLEVIDGQIESYKNAVEEAKVRGATADDVERMAAVLAGMQRRRGQLVSKGATAEAGVPTEKAKGPMDLIREASAAAKKELSELTNWGHQTVEGAKAIGSAFAEAFKNVASGSMTAQEALASMMQSIASHFLDMAAQIIAQQMTMIILGTIMRALGVGGGLVSANTGGFAGMTVPNNALGEAMTFQMMSFAADGAYWQGGFQAFADGGVVNGPTLGLVGEGGEPEYIIPASKMSGAMARYNAGARGNAVIPAEGGEGISSMSIGAPLGAIDVRYSVERINSVDYVTADQFQRGIAQAAQQGAKQGEQATLRRLQQSRSTRSRLGMS